MSTSDEHGETTSQRTVHGPHSSPAVHRRGAVRRTLGWRNAIILGLAAILFRAPVLWLRPTCNEAIFACVGNVWFRHGGLPYQDAMENKTPGVFCVFGLSWLLLHSPFLVPRLASSACAAATAVLIGWLGARLFCRAAGLAGGLAFGVLSAVFFTPAAQSEAFMLPGTVAAICLTWHSCTAGAAPGRSALAAGIVAGLGFLFKQVACAALCASILAAMACRDLRWRRLAATVVGFCLPLAPWVVYFAWHGMLTEAYEGVVLQAISPGAIRWDSGLHDVLALAAKRLAPTFPLLAGGAWALARPLRRSPRRLQVLMVAWLVLAGGAALGAGRMAPHQLLQLLPPVCVLGGGGLTDLWSRLGGRSGRGSSWILRALIILLVAAGVVSYAPRQVRAYLHQQTEKRRRDQEFRRVGEYVEARTGFDEPIYLAGQNPHVYVYADRVPAHRYFSIYFTAGAPRRLAEVLDALVDDPPRYIVTEPAKLRGYLRGALSEEDVRRIVAGRYRRRLQNQLRFVELYERENPRAGSHRTDHTTRECWNVAHVRHPPAGRRLEWRPCLASACLDWIPVSPEM